MTDERTLLAASLFAAASLALVWKCQNNRSRPPYPPGPKGYPLIGNILDIPQDIPVWQAFIPLAQKSDTDVLYLKLLTKDVVVLNSTEAITDLTEKRSSIYSDRPRLPMLELMDAASRNFALMGYGSQLRRCRRLFHEFLNVNAVSRFDSYLNKHTFRFLSRLAETPGDFLGHAQFVTGSLIMEMTYGIEIESHEDKFLQAAERGMEHLGDAVIPGAFLVDTFPVLSHVPDWFPGAGFKRFAKVGRELLDTAVNGPLDHVKESLKVNGANFSIAASCFDRMTELADQGLDESVIRSVTATMYLDPLDLADLFPDRGLTPTLLEGRKRSWTELWGMNELLRWGCPDPIGVPKRVMEDNIYEGYYIPAGATIIENVWAICYDETVYPAPHTYDPERFLKDGKLNRSVKDPEDRVFGTGRRLCPGRLLALPTLFLNIACALAVFDIEAPAGEKLESKFRETPIRYPLPFKCVIKPRSEAKMTLVRDAMAGLN